MPKNIVICCDGTNNEYGDHNSNVVLLFQALVKESSSQVGFYDPGVGTLSAHPFLTRTARGISRLLGAGFGRGITRNITEAYKFVMQNYAPGDRVFLFGFSRGAYTARAVAAMIHKCGLLQRDNENLLSYAVKMFKRERREDIYTGFKRTFSRECLIHFLGLWDTVTSVGWVWDPVTLPYTTNNPDVKVVRHAVSIDERRAFFRQNLWGRKFAAKQDLKEVWFPGVHSDVGGGYPQREAGLSKIALEWMMAEAIDHGLIVDGEKARKVVNDPVGPDEIAPMHNSLKLAWWPAELWPKLVSGPPPDYRKRPSLNLAKRRKIAEKSVIHESALSRMGEVDNYRPANLPKEYRQEPSRTIESVLKSTVVT